MSNEVVYNAGFGGFGLSKVAMEMIKDLGVEAEYDWDIARHDSRLVDVVKRLGQLASSSYANLQIETIEGNKYYIDEYDGSESIITPADMKDRWIIIK